MLFADICMHASGTVNLSNYNEFHQEWLVEMEITKLWTMNFSTYSTILKGQLELCQNLPELNNVPRDSSGGTTEAYISVVRSWIKRQI